MNSMASLGEQTFRRRKVCSPRLLYSYIAKTIKERKKDQEQVREKSFPEMKRDVGMTTAQKSKETRRMEMGSIFVLYIQPTIPTYTSGSFRL